MATRKKAAAETTRKVRTPRAKYFVVKHGEDSYIAHAVRAKQVRDYALRGELTIRTASQGDLLAYHGEVVDLTKE